MHTHTLSALKKALHSKSISSVELVKHFLNRAKKYNPSLNAFITLTEEQALAQAQLADKKISRGEVTELTGIPIAHKDIFCTAGVKTSCGSKMLDNFTSPYNATLIEKFNSAGAVMLGKTNMDEFAMGSCNENSYYGPVKNPWDLQCVPGGSSGGSAAVVAARIALAATGTDTGGSIRQPASFCGISGLKPTYGRVSRYGMVAFASSLDQGGPIAPSAEDLAILLKIMAGHDSKDSTSSSQSVPDYTATLNDDIRGLKIGIPKEFFTEDLPPPLSKILFEAKSVFEKMGATFVDISLPHSAAGVATYYIIAPAEASANLARYDGVRYGYRCKNPVNLEDLYKRSRGEGFGNEVKRRILMGTYVLSAGYYDAYYVQAQRVRRLIKNDFDHAFQSVDMILAPTAPSVAFKLGEKAADPISAYLSDIFTIPVNLAGLPALSIPAGFSGHLPVGMQLIGNYFNEAKLLNAAHRFQLETDWHQKIPEAFQ